MYLVFEMQDYELSSTPRRRRMQIEGPAIGILGVDYAL